MDVVIEDYTPYDQSLIWSIHAAYFEQCGSAAWDAGRIPHFVTNNYAIARQYAQFLIELARTLDEADGGARGDVRVLEVGSGSGGFAASLFGALEHGTGEAGRALAGRLRYVLSDFAERSLREFVARGRLRALVAEGRVLPAILDMRAPDQLAGLGGEEVAGPFTAVIGNYVCCVSPLKVIARSKEGFFEKRVRVSVDVDVGEAPAGAGAAGGARRPAAAKREAPAVDPSELRARVLSGDATREDLLRSLRIDARWDAVDLADRMENSVHEEAVRRALAPLAEGTVHYPEPFLECLRRLGARMRPGGVALVTDFGRRRRKDLAGRQDRPAVHYGNTFNHPVDFAALDAFAASAGLSIARTKRPLRSLQTAALRYAPDFGERLRAAFVASFVRMQEGQDLLDFRCAAQAAADRGEPIDAARLYERALRLDPRSPDILCRLGEQCVDAGEPERALKYLARGARLDEAGKHDFAFHAGRALLRAGRLDEAVAQLRRSLERDDCVATHANLALALERLKDYKGAYIHFRRAIDLEPDGDLANALRRKVVEQYLPRDSAVESVEPEEPDP